MYLDASSSFNLTLALAAHTTSFIKEQEADHHLG